MQLLFKRLNQQKMLMEYHLQDKKIEVSFNDEILFDSDIITKEAMWKGKYRSTDNTENRKRKRKILPKNEETSGRKAHTNTRKFNRNNRQFLDWRTRPRRHRVSATRGL